MRDHPPVPITQRPQTCITSGLKLFLWRLFLPEGWRLVSIEGVLQWAYWTGYEFETRAERIDPAAIRRVFGAKRA